MTDKSLVKQRFEKSFDTYDDYAVIQKITAAHLTKLLCSDFYPSVFEIGCATGVLTKELINKITFERYIANDIVEKSRQYISNITDKVGFIPGDIETIDLNEKFDLIISNACLQWCSDIYSTVNVLHKMLNSGGKFIFSVFGNDNLNEVKNIFNIQTEPLITDKFIFPNIEVKEEKIILEFDSLTEILKHMKYTGVNAIKPFMLTKSSLKKYEEQYKNLYSRNGKLLLTYNPVYVVISE